MELEILIAVVSFLAGSGLVYWRFPRKVVAEHLSVIHAHPEAGPHDELDCECYDRGYNKGWAANS